MSPVKVAFVWHMHQPWYVWPDSDRAALPFARLHAYASYHDMPWLVRQFPNTTATFNLVPSLMKQIVGYARGEITDQPLELCRRPAADLDADEQAYLLTHFPSGHPDHIGELSPGYARLSHKRGLFRNADRIAAACRDFALQDWLDLQVWMNLACCGYALQRENGVVRELWAKDRDFTEGDKAALLAELEGILARLPALYAAARAEGRAELSASPFYHPILPLLCDMRDAVRRIRREDLPEVLWRAPEEALRQLRRARAQHADMFGEAPQGLWPSEGAVSDAALAAAAQTGYTWAASDEDILLNSLRRDAAGRASPEELYRPYRAGDTPLSLVFRDHSLSDRIGFVYHSWAPRDAAADFVGQLKQIAANLPGGNHPALVCVVLDGENPWGAYRDGGEGLLRALYVAIEREEGIETTSIAGYLREFPATERLESVFPGSWIDHSYRTWVGGREHRQAWDLLHGAYDAAQEADPGGQADLARDYLMRAEGSDWFWWYSEFHHDEYEAVFDELFRANLGAVYSALGRPEPASLAEPIATVTLGWLARSPAGAMQAVIDGRATGYFEWQPAGLMRTASLASAMHRADCLAREVYFGFDAEALYLRVDTVGNASAVLTDCALRFTFPAHPDHALTVGAGKGGAGSATLAGDLASVAEAAVDTIVELRIPIEALGAAPGKSVAFALSVECSGQTLERWPVRGFVRLEVPTADVVSSSWIV
jgi:alpha-amylase/alpha-mannosidase (GH57 family)